MFDVRRIEWDAYFRDFVIGIKKYLLKEDPSDLTAAKRRFKRFVAICSSYLYLFSHVDKTKCYGITFD